jgi:hypothetical protein
MDQRWKDKRGELLYSSDIERISERNFDWPLDDTEKSSCEAIGFGVDKFLGTHKTPNYSELVAFK